MRKKVIIYQLTIIVLLVLFSCNKDAIIHFEPIASLKLQIIGQNTKALPTEFEAKVCIFINNELKKCNSIPFVQDGANYRSEGSIEVPFNTPMIINVTIEDNGSAWGGESETVTIAQIPTAQIISIIVIGLNGESLPIATTSAVTDVGQFEAISGGNILDDGGFQILARGLVWSASMEPTLQNNLGVTNDGMGTGEFTSSITGLDINTTYHVRAYATNYAGTNYGPQLEFTTEGIIYGGGVTDIDGNSYITVIIGAQEWMAENLKTTTYNNATPITLVEDNLSWTLLTTEAYCWYENDGATYKDAYGALYNWFSVETGVLCPTGWHVPTDEEWKTLEGIVDSQFGIADPTWDNEGWRGFDVDSKLKAQIGWYNDVNGNDNFGFFALPGGGRNGVDGSFVNAGYGGYWWSSTENDATTTWDRLIYYEYNGVYRVARPKELAGSIRCLKN